jgi:Type I phosphodiesterase / nucleotide pyrophosphatase
LLFLTADHGGSETPAHLNSLRIPAGVFPESLLESRLEQVIEQKKQVKGNFIASVSNQQIYFHKDSIQLAGLDEIDLGNLLKSALIDSPGVYDVLTREELRQLPADYPFASEMRKGIHPHRSGDLILVLDPAWHPDDKMFKTGGATHGSQYAYDTHVPLLWYGWRIPHGESFARVEITDIAPTLAAMLRIIEPNGNTGKVIEGLMEELKQR